MRKIPVPCPAPDCGKLLVAHVLEDLDGQPYIDVYDAEANCGLYHVTTRDADALDQRVLDEARRIGRQP